MMTLVVISFTCLPDRFLRAKVKNFFVEIEDFNTTKPCPENVVVGVLPSIFITYRVTRHVKSILNPIISTAATKSNDCFAVYDKLMRLRSVWGYMGNCHASLQMCICMMLTTI